MRTYKVPDMSCDHCKMRIEAAVGGDTRVRSIDVDLDGKTVKVETDLEDGAVIALFEKAGYTATRA